MPGMASSLAFARNVLEVTMVRMPHFPMAAAMPSRPAVKFRFTGMRPARVMPTFTSAPATVGGSRTPIISSAAETRRTQFATRIPPVSRRP